VHNVIVLALAQMLASSGMTVVVILGGIVAAQMASPSLATVPLSLGIVAVALTTVPAALLMRRVGRRAGFITGAGIGMLGGFVAAQAISIASFPLFCLATALLGASTPSLSNIALPPRRASLSSSAAGRSPMSS
jgi:MFS family permease